MKAIILADPTTRVPQGKDIDEITVNDIDNIKVGEYSQWFAGRIGITRLYNSALSDAQVLQNYNTNKSIYGL